MTAGAGISAGAGLVCLVVAAIMWFVAGRWQPRIVAVLVIAGMSGLAGSGLASWLHRTAVYVDGVVAQFVGQLGGVVATSVVAIVAIALVTVALWQNKVTGRTLVAAAFVPVTVAMIPGLAGQVGTSVVNGVATAAGMAVGALFGIH
jgi:hypothetical protein